MRGKAAYALIALGVLVIGVLVPIEGANAKTLMCQWRQKSACVPGSGCKRITATIRSIIDLDGRKYIRCDDKGCDTFDAAIDWSAHGYSTIEVRGRALFVKIAPDGTATEVAALMNAVFVSQGQCR